MHQTQIIKTKLQPDTTFLVVGDSVIDYPDGAISRRLYDRTAFFFIHPEKGTVFVSRTRRECKLVAAPSMLRYDITKLIFELDRYWGVCVKVLRQRHSSAGEARPHVMAQTPNEYPSWMFIARYRIFECQDLRPISTLRLIELCNEFDRNDVPLFRWNICRWSTAQLNS